jgi:hypothetical protein
MWKVRRGNVSMNSRQVAYIIRVKFSHSWLVCHHEKDIEYTHVLSSQLATASVAKKKKLATARFFLVHAKQINSCSGLTVLWNDDGWSLLYWYKLPFLYIWSTSNQTTRWSKRTPNATNGFIYKKMKYNMCFCGEKVTQIHEFYTWENKNTSSQNKKKTLMSFWWGRSPQIST